jgi:hypothetical protein
MSQTLYDTGSGAAPQRAAGLENMNRVCSFGRFPAISQQIYSYKLSSRLLTSERAKGSTFRTYKRKAEKLPKRPARERGM